jgi:hypothetical protein
MNRGAEGIQRTEQNASTVRGKSDAQKDESKGTKNLRQISHPPYLEAAE